VPRGSVSAACSSQVSMTVIEGRKLSSWGTYEIDLTKLEPRGAPLTVTAPVRRPTDLRAARMSRRVDLPGWAGWFG
jgi:hypothetical protein